MTETTTGILFGGLGSTVAVVIFYLGRYSVRVEKVEEELAKLNAKIEKQFIEMRGLFIEHAVGSRHNGK